MNMKQSFGVSENRTQHLANHLLKTEVPASVDKDYRSILERGEAPS